MFTLVKKRDGRLVPFDQSRITNAISRAMQATGEGDLTQDPNRVSDRVIKDLRKKFPDNYVPAIEEIQDFVEEALILMDFARTAKSYILYRSERSQIREKQHLIPEHVRKLADESKKYFKNPLGEFMYYRTYSRWIDEEGRRETWSETVGRYMDFMRENLGDKLSKEEYEEVRMGILSQQAMPSMRLLWGAGEAARKNHAVAYNCSFIAISQIQDFAEVMFLGMSGCGVGFSVEHQHVEKLPQIKRQTGEKLPTFVVPDSKQGWCDALTAGLEAWFGGKDIDFDFSQVRPAGARLKTMGGKASGPQPLIEILEFAKRKVLARQGKRLRPIDVHDIVCREGESVVSGGVRRTALISLFDADDADMIYAKSGQFYLTEPQRSLANNSIAYTEKPTAAQFLETWLALAKNKTGEPGMFNRAGLKYQMPERRWKINADKTDKFGLNPCGEINLRSKQFCNLTEVVCRAEDTEETLMKKMRLATIIGTYQSMLTNFTYLSEDWKKNCEEERLLGVSLNGQYDCPTVQNATILKKLRDYAVEVNKEYAKKFGINPSTAITTTKPSGNGSQTFDCSSGMHPRYAPYYIRRVRISATDGLFQMMKDQKVPYYPEVGQSVDSAHTYVLEFPVKAPEGTKVFKNDLSAIEQLEYWKMLKKNYTEHNPSVTISVGEHEWIGVANWLYNEWDILGGLSFLPREDHVYKLAPYEQITKEKYEEMVKNFPNIDFAQIVAYEKSDETKGAKELACVSGACEIDLGGTKVSSESSVNAAAN